MGPEEISLLMQLHSANASTEANLWMMYVAATLACAGFGVTTNTLTSFKMGLIASVGFLAFTCGQFKMVLEIIAERQLIVEQLIQVSSQHSLAPFIGKITTLGLTVNGAIATHAVVDLCVVALIMFRPTSNWWHSRPPQNNRPHSEQHQ